MKKQNKYVEMSIYGISKKQNNLQKDAINSIFTKRAFTLVELIVVVTILWILSTIWFVAYSWYMAWVRDTNRISQLKSISDWLELYRTKHDLPLPDSKLDITSSWSLIWYQWYIWKNVLEIIEYSSEWVDPKDGTYFSYYLTKDRRYYQLMAFLEEEPKKISFKNTKIFAVDYSDRYPYTIGKKLWILTDENNNPIQEVKSGSLDISDVWTLKLKSYLNKDEYVTWTWTSFYKLIKVDKVWWKFWRVVNNEFVYVNPTEWACPEWYTAVPWNPDFPYADWSVKDFCVAKYQMSYDDRSERDNSNWNWRNYNSTKTPVSMANRLPIINITQNQAITECKKIWAHLITNNEWMTIARNIEKQWENWSGWSPWNWWIWQWVLDWPYWCANWKVWDSEWRNTDKREWVTWADESRCSWAKNRFKLTNGQYVYDFSWLFREHVNRSDNPNDTTAWTGPWNICWGSNFDWKDNVPEVDSCQAGYWPTTSYVKNWTNIWMWNVEQSSSNWRVFFRWVDAPSSTNWWMYSLLVGYSPDNAPDRVSFRCVYSSD